jgi:hypothetical protein
LQDIQVAHNDRVTIRPFRHHEEALNGADWEWWFYAGDVGFGMRVQAKRAKHNGSYDLRYRINGRLQSDLLIEDAAASACLPVYVFYNHTTWPAPKSRKDLASTGCRHSITDQRHLGVTVTSALTVQRTLLQPRASTSYVRNRSRPWHALLCDGNANGVPNVTLPQQRLRRLHWDAAEDLEQALAREETPLTIRRELRDMDMKEEEPLASRTEEPARRTKRRSAPSTPPKSPGQQVVKRTVYGQLERIAQGPSRLPERILRMVRDPELAIAPDKRAAGVVLLNLRAVP